MGSALRELDFRFFVIETSGSQYRRGIPDSLSCIPDSKVQDSVFHKQKFP